MDPQPWIVILGRVLNPRRTTTSPSLDTDKIRSIDGTCFLLCFLVLGYKVLIWSYWYNTIAEGVECVKGVIRVEEAHL